jgi:hypothetical protein
MRDSKKQQNYEKNKKGGRSGRHGTTGGRPPRRHHNTEWGVLALSHGDAETLHRFLNEFGYTSVEARLLPARLNEKAIGENAEAVTAFTLIRHEHVDIELLKEEWECFDGVGTSEALSYFELKLNKNQQGQREMAIGKIVSLGA